MRAYIFLIKFLLLGAFFIVSGQNLHLSDHDERGQFFSSLGSWVKDVASNVGTLVGYVVKVEWLPDEAKPNTTEFAALNPVR